MWHIDQAFSTCGLWAKNKRGTCVNIAWLFLNRVRMTVLIGAKSSEYHLSTVLLTCELPSTMPHPHHNRGLFNRIFNVRDPLDLCVRVTRLPFCRDGPVHAISTSTTKRSTEKLSRTVLIVSVISDNISAVNINWFEKKTPFGMPKVLSLFIFVWICIQLYR